MRTRCPNCGTAFRVTSVQIKARAGTVRCGQCHFVFNALDMLEDVAPGISELVETAETANEELEPVAEAAAEEINGLEAFVAEEAAADVRDELAVSESIIEPTAAEVPPEPEHDYLAAPALSGATRPTAGWPWIAGSAIAVLMMLLQVAYYYRVELAAMRPEWRPALVSLCSALHCDVPRPRHIDTISIDSSDLRPDAQHPGHLLLSATLRSKSSLAQEWPTLELTLTDVADHRLAVRQFAAPDYLPKERNRPTLLAAGFPPNGEIPVTLALDIDGLQAAGYRLYVFYP